jgi:hypothetical protein
MSGDDEVAGGFLSTLLYRQDGVLGAAIVRKLREVDYDVESNCGSDDFCEQEYNRDACLGIGIVGRQYDILAKACCEYKRLTGSSSIVSISLGVGSMDVAKSCVETVAKTPIDKSVKRGGVRTQLLIETPNSVSSDGTSELTVPFFKLMNETANGNAIIAAFVCSTYHGEIAMNLVATRILARFVTIMTIGHLTNGTYTVASRK